MRKTFVFAGLFLHTFVSKHVKQLIFSALIGFFTTLILLQIFPILKSFVNRKHEKIGVVGTFTDGNLPQSIQNKISLGLTRIQTDGSATSSASSIWDKEEDGKKYTFYLKNNLYWHDGKKFTANDINYKIKGAKFEILDDYKLRIILSENYAPLPVFLSQPLYRENLTGLGFYKVIQLIRNKENNNIIQLTLLPSEKGFPTETYKFYKNKNDVILAFKLGEIDKINDLEDIREFDGWPNINISQRTNYNKVVALFYNFTDQRFKEKETRQALAYAIPPFENFEKSVSPISPLSWAYSNKVRLYKYDEAAAQKIISKSSLVNTEIIISAYAHLLPIAQQIADAWNKINLNAKIKVENSIPSDFHVFLYTFNIPTDPDQYFFWQSTQEGTNITKYKSLKIDKLLEDGRKTIDENQRRKIYADFQLYLVDDAPAIFLYYPKIYNIERK